MNLYSSYSLSTRGNREKGWGWRSISFRDRSVEKVGRRKQGHWHWPQPARERVVSSPFVPFPSRWMPPSIFPFPSPPFLLRHRQPLLYVSLRGDRDPKRRIGLVIFAPAAEGGGGQAGRPVRALIRDERVMSLTNKPSRYERFFWIAWRPMSWFLLSPRFDATDARPFLSTRPPLSRRSLFTTVFKFFQFYLPRVRFIPCLFTRCTALFASSLIQKFCLLSYIAYIRYPMYFEGYIYSLLIACSLTLISWMKSKVERHWRKDQGSGCYSIGKEIRNIWIYLILWKLLVQPRLTIEEIARFSPNSLSL